MIRLSQFVAAVSATTLLILAIPAQATNTRTSFGVSVTVSAVAHMEQDSTRSVVITREDVERGYVDVRGAGTLRISSNSPQGYTLDIYSVANLFSNVLVSGLDGDIALSDEGGTIVHRWSHAQKQVLNLSYRFTLRPEIQPGIYSFPLQIAVRPL